MKHIQQKMVLNCDKVNLLNDISQNDSSFGMFFFTNYSHHFLFLPRLTQMLKAYPKLKMCESFGRMSSRLTFHMLTKNSSRICLYRNCR